MTVPNDLHAREPAIAGTPDGHTTAVWSESESGRPSQIYSSQSNSGASWGQPGSLVSTPGLYVYGPSVAVQADGTAAATWFESNETSEEWIEAAVRHGESWSSPLRLSAPGADAYRYNGGVDLVANAAGFLAVWNQYEPEGNLYSVHTDQLLGGIWQGDQMIATSQHPISNSTVANDQAGEATVVWVDYSTATLQSATLRGGQWTTQPIEGSHQFVGCGTPQPGVGVDATGAGTAAWVDEGQVVTDVLPSGGTWGQPLRLTDLPETSGAYEAVLNVDPAGDAALIWGRRNGGEGEGSSGIEASYRSAGGSWEAPLGLAKAGPELTVPSLAISDQGWAVGSWGEDPYSPTASCATPTRSLPGSLRATNPRPAGKGHRGIPARAPRRSPQAWRRSTSSSRIPAFALRATPTRSQQ